MDCIKDNLPGSKLLPILEEFKPDVVGSQCYSMDLNSIKSVLQTVKDYNRDVLTIIGGAHPTAVPEHSLRFFGKDLLDFVFVGEGEIGFPLFLNEIDGSNSPNFLNVPGLGWVENGKLVINSAVQEDNLDKLGMPAWDLLMPESYPFSPHGVVCRKFPIAPIMATRGCPYKCTFCSSAGTKLRKRSVESLIKEVKLLYHSHGIREFHMVDDNFTMNMDYAKELLEALNKLNLKVSWATPNGVRLDRLDREIIELMKNTGFYSISVGIESGSDRIRAKMKKGTSLDKIQKVLQMIYDVGGIDLTGFFILGFPGETREDIEKSIRLSRKLPLHRATFHSFIPLPGAEIWKEMEASGELGRVDWERYFFWAGMYVPQGLTQKKLKRLHRKAFLLFYIRPRIIVQNLKFILSPRVAWYAICYLWRRVKP